MWISSGERENESTCRSWIWWRMLRRERLVWRNVQYQGAWTKGHWFWLGFDRRADWVFEIEDAKGLRGEAIGQKRKKQKTGDGDVVGDENIIGKFKVTHYHCELSHDKHEIVIFIFSNNYTTGVELNAPGSLNYMSWNRRGFACMYTVLVDEWVYVFDEYKKWWMWLRSQWCLNDVNINKLCLDHAGTFHV